MKRKLSLIVLVAMLALACFGVLAACKGAMSLKCVDENGKKITVRTEVLYKQVDGAMVLVKQNEFVGKTINVVGIADYFNLNDANEYQVRVTAYGDITIVAE